MRLALSRFSSALYARSSTPGAAALTRVASRSQNTTGSSNVLPIQAASSRQGTARSTVMSSPAMTAASNAVAARVAASSSSASTAATAAVRSTRGGPPRPAAVFKLRSVGSASSAHYNCHSSRPRRSFVTATPRAVATDASSSSSSDAAAPAPSAKVDSGVSLLSSELTWPARDQTCGDLREGDVGRTVTLCGWVDKQRDMGGIVFADIRDHTGFVQVVSDADTPKAATDALAAMRAEWVVCVEGRVKTRTAPNDKIPTGRVEIAADKVTILNTVAKSLPFSISGAPGDGGDDESLREEVRLKHRVLDLRRPQMVRNLRLRAKTIRAMRAVLEEEHGFLEVRRSRAGEDPPLPTLPPCARVVRSF